jgi:hypothetical protein
MMRPKVSMAIISTVLQQATSNHLTTHPDTVALGNISSLSSMGLLPLYMTEVGILVRLTSNNIISSKAANTAVLLADRMEGKGELSFLMAFQRRS